MKQNRILILCSALIFFVLITGVLYLVSCSETPDEASLTTPHLSSTSTPPASPTPFPTPAFFVMPESDNRPVAVMIDNEGYKCLPQGGLNYAQFVYEIIVEGGETRYLAVFYGVNPSMIGPVRSTRHYYLDYVIEHDAIFVHYGHSPQALTDINNLGVNNINGVFYSGGIFWNITQDRSNWQDTYTSMEKIQDYLDKLNYRRTTEKRLPLEYHEEESSIESDEMQKAYQVDIRYSTGNISGYRYDPELKVYNKLRKDVPQIERVSEQQLIVKNIIILRVSNRLIPGDNLGRQNLHNIGNGTGMFISNGKMKPITWSKDSRTSRTEYLCKHDNSELVLNQGQTWIHLVPVTGDVTVNE